MAQMLAMSKPALSAPQRELATAINEKSLRMTDMLTNLLDMARIQSGEIRLRIEWQSMEEIIGGALKGVQGTLGERHISVYIDPGVPLVECDAVLIERVLANLLENAGKFTPLATSVEILVRCVDEYLHVSVRDHGPGVVPGHEQRVFEKFTRGSTESATPGVGLGLAICRAIVAAHRGRIWVEPTPVQGATFTFSLPLGTPPAVDGADDATDVPKDTASESASRRPAKRSTDVHTHTDRAGA